MSQIFKIVTTVIDGIWMLLLLYSYFTVKDKPKQSVVFYYMLFFTVLLNVIEIWK